MMNNVVYVGRIVKTPEVKELENGNKVSNLCVAVPRSYKNANGEYDTDFISCSIWNGIAENTSNYCKQGDMIGIKGHLQTRIIENENGKHNELEVVAEKVTFLSSAKEKENQEMDI